MFCKHGTYVGSPHGADHMCGRCEDGDSGLCVSTFPTDEGRAKMLATLTSELQLAHNGWILDDSVMGSLNLNDALEFLADFGLADTPPNRKMFGRAVNIALREGF